MGQRPVSRSFRRRAAVALTALATLAGGFAVGAAPAQASNPVTPGDFTGLGFDQCTAPSSAAMSAWWSSSPYTAVGIYISGDSRGCTSQPNLSATWVAQQQQLGWKLLPITLGPQASCTTRERYLHQVRINPSTSGSYASARSQGSAEATKAVAAAKQLDISAHSTLWYDIEAFNTSNTACRDSAMAFLSGWTGQVRQLGYVAGAYSSAASGIKAMATASGRRPVHDAGPDLDRRLERRREHPHVLHLRRLLEQPPPGAPVPRRPQRDATAASRSTSTTTTSTSVAARSRPRRPRTAAGSTSPSPTTHRCGPAPPTRAAPGRCSACSRRRAPSPDTPAPPTAGTTRPRPPRSVPSSRPRASTSTTTGTSATGCGC